MATGRIRARFFHTQTRPAGLSYKPGPGPFIKQILNPKPAPLGLRGPDALMPSQAQNQNHKLPFMIFRPKITNTNTNPNTITNINIENPNTNVRFVIFPFKITNQTQILDL